MDSATIITIDPNRQELSDISAYIFGIPFLIYQVFAIISLIVLFYKCHLSKEKYNPKFFWFMLFAVILTNIILMLIASYFGLNLISKVERLLTY